MQNSPINEDNNLSWLACQLRRLRQLVSRDVIVTDIGEEARDVVVGKNIIKIGALSLPTPVAVLILIAIVLGVIGIGIVARNTFATSRDTSTISQVLTAPTPTPTATVPTATPTATPQPTATPLAFATASADETLILVATFHSTTATNTEPHMKIWRKVEEELERLGDSKVRAAVEPTELTADARADAEALGGRYNASMVIWGEDTGVEVIVNYLNLREPDFDAAKAKIVEQERTQLANPSAYAQFITTDLPGQLTYFALFAAGQAHYVDEDYIRAADAIDAAVASLPGDVEPPGLAGAYYRLGWLFQQPLQEDLDRAVEAYDTAIRLNPDDARAYSNRGAAYYNQGKVDKAIEDFDTAIRLYPNYVEAYSNRGLAYAAQEDLEKAVADFDTAIRLNPDDARDYYNRGTAYATQGDLEKAIADFDTAIRLNPDYAWAYNNRGTAYAIQGKLDRAIEDYDAAIRLNPDYVGAYSNRGLAYAAQGDLHKVIEDFVTAIRLDPNDVGAYNNLCWTYGLLSEPQTALPYCQKAIKLDPQPNFFDSRGLVYALLGDSSAAIADFQGYVDWAERQNDPSLSPDLEKRKAWIAALKAGENPFTPEVLLELRSK